MIYRIFRRADIGGKQRYVLASEAVARRWLRHGYTPVYETNDKTDARRAFLEYTYGGLDWK